MRDCAGRVDDIPGILVLQEANLAERDGGLAVRQTADWFRHAILEKSLIVGRTERKVVGYVLGTSLAAKAHVMIIQTMLRNFPPRPIAISMARSAWQKRSVEKGWPALFFKCCERIWPADPQ